VRAVYARPRYAAQQAEAVDRGESARVHTYGNVARQMPRLPASSRSRLMVLRCSTCVAAASYAE